MANKDYFEEAAHAVTTKRFDKRDFAFSFPQYADYSYEQLMKLDADEQHEIACWYFTKNDDVSYY